MKTNKLIIASLAIVAIIFAACSPAQVASGNFTITAFSTTGLPVSSGTTGTVKITENGANMVNIVVSTGGNPDVNVTAVPVTKVSIPGINEVSFNLTGNYDVSGAYEEVSGVNALALTITNNIDTTYMSVDAKK